MMWALSDTSKTHQRPEVVHEQPNMWQSHPQVSPTSLAKIKTDHVKNFFYNS
jgi:hypothetical protein